jgi:predicted RNase H-like HicB family nuclease
LLAGKVAAKSLFGVKLRAVAVGSRGTSGATRPCGWRGSRRLSDWANYLDLAANSRFHNVMRQTYHTIIKPESTGFFVGWVEEIPGTMTHGRSLKECRRKLRNALLLMVETHRDEARIALDASCIQEPIEIDTSELRAPPHQLV